MEAGGRRLYYSGDFRGHGRKQAIFHELLRKPPEGVHVLLLEGTHIRDEADALAIPRSSVLYLTCRCGGRFNFLGLEFQEAIDVGDS